jgi:hypothetical protein
MEKLSQWSTSTETLEEATQAFKHEWGMMQIEVREGHLVDH